MRRFALFYVAPTLLLILGATAPLVLGNETLYTRDVFSSHYGMKTSQAEAMRSGELPLIDRYRGGGQPLLGNPNALPLYPDNLLYLVASPLWSLNAHFWLHLFLAPFAGFWLGREWGLRREAAWIVGVTFACSGFFLSLFNLYNLVAGAALAPAFVAALLSLGRATTRGWRLAVAAALWALLLLGGDPLFAALSLLLGATAAAVRAPECGWIRLASRLGISLLLGTLLALPMLVEFLRILPLSFRGYWQYSLEAALAQSWDPRSAPEWLLPFFFGRPDFTFWGLRFFGGNPPLLYSLYPGLLVLALVPLAGRGRARLWAWSACGAGLFFALGAWNPVVRVLYQLPGAASLRYPVKFWLLVAVGGALLCGLGFEHLREADGRRHYGVLAGLLILFGVAWLLFAWEPPFFLEGLRSLSPERLVGSLLDREILYWRYASAASIVVLLLLSAAVWLTGRRPELGGALLVAIHVAAQSFLLQPLYDGDDVRYYRTPPEALSAVPEEAVVVHGGSGDLFGAPSWDPELGSPIAAFPDPRFFWLARSHFAQLYPFSGIQWGRRYELNHSPEGLDTFLVISLARALRQMDDPSRVRILAASGVDTLLLDRELSPEALPQTTLRGRFRGVPLDLWVYEIRNPAAEAQLVGTVRRAPHMNAALDQLADPGFDPRAMVVLPGEGETTERPVGRVDVVERSIESLDLRVTSPAGGVLLVQRAYLDLYRATVDDRPAPTLVANLHRIGVEVPPGEHRVRLWLDRRPTRIAFTTSGLAAVLLVALVAFGRRLEGWGPFATASGTSAAPPRS